MSFEGKVVLVTGASSGIGAAAALHFARGGAHLVLNGRNSENLDRVCRECQEASGRRPVAAVADVSLEAGVESIFATLTKHHRRLDVLVNNAGFGRFSDVEHASLEEYDSVMATNVRGVYHLTTLVVPLLIASKGNIVNVSSVAGLRSFPGALTYCMSKAALDQFTGCAALDLAPKGVRVNSVNPGVIVTDFHKRIGMDEKTYREYLARCKETHPLGKIGQPEDVAEAIAFLASEAASNITGVTLPVDGGKHLACPR